MRLLSLVLFASLVACGQAPTSSTSADPVDSTPAPVVTVASKVVGQYAVRVRVTTSQNVPLIGQATGTAAVYKLATIAENGEGFTLTESACEFDFEGGTAPLKLSLTNQAIRSSSVVTTPIEISDDNGTIRFQREFASSTLGVALADENEALPTSKNDSRVVDADKDGQAGVTARASGTVKFGFIKRNIDADIYFVQRTREKYSGTLVADGRLSGSVISETEQSILGSNNVLLTLGGPIPSTQIVDQSSVEFVRVGDAETCDTVKFKTAF